MWKNDQYLYSVGVLKAIAEWYDSIYEVMMLGDYQITNPFSLIDFKVDFDMALNEIGRGNWKGLESMSFRHYKHFSKMQRVIIAEILGIYDLEPYGFYEVRKLRHKAFKAMVDVLNGT